MLALKDNQPTLHERVADYFVAQFETDNQAGKVRQQREVETRHGRSETRTTYVAPVPKDLAGAAAGGGAGEYYPGMKDPQ